jgi:hypothetical protein
MSPAGLTIKEENRISVFYLGEILKFDFKVSIYGFAFFRRMAGL